MSDLSKSLENVEHKVEECKTACAHTKKKSCARVHCKTAHTSTHSSLLNSTFLHQIGDFFQDLGLLVISIILMYKPNWDIIDPIVSIIVSIVSNTF